MEKRMKLVCMIFLLFPLIINCHKENDEDLGIFPGIKEDNSTRICPEAILITPCLCSLNIHSDGTHYLIMDCSDVSSSDQLRTILSQTFPTNGFDELIISGNHQITSLSEGDFGITTFTEVFFQDDFEITSVDSNIFSMMENTLEKISFKFCTGIIDLNFDFTNLVLLDSIDLTSCSLTTLNLTSPTAKYVDLKYNDLKHKGFWIHLPNVEYLTMSSNFFEELPDISKSIRLYDFDIGYNVLTVVLPNELCYSDNLKNVELGRNDLATIGVGSVCIHQDVSGGIVSLYGNNITTVDESIYKPILEEAREGGLHIEENPLICGCDIAWLFDGYMNKIYPTTKCENGTFLTDLDRTYYDENC